MNPTDATGTAPALLSARGLSVRRGRTEILRGVDLDLRAGEVTALLGPNGAGKSTLLEALAGLLPAASGRVERRGRVALALQSADMARRSVTANVTMTLGWWGVPRGQRRPRAAEALAAMGAAHLAGRPARALSGGERRRVHLARAVAVRPDVLLLDEPFAGLDAATRAGLLDDTGAALRAWASATLVVVHDRAEAWALADRLLVLIDGRIVADGAPRRLLEFPPTVPVARFLGFDGTLAGPDGTTVLTRPHHVVLDPDGPLTATVARVVPVEDGVRVELAVDGGRVFALADLPGPAAGDRVAVRVTGGAPFAGGGAQLEPTVPPDAAQAVRP